MKNLIIAFIVLISMSSFAQTEDNKIVREGFFIGFSVGGGISAIEDSYRDVIFNEIKGGISLPNLKLGWMINDRCAVMASIPGITYDYEGKDRSFDAILPSVQYWVKDGWWLSTGAGLAMDMPALYEGNLSDENWNFGWAAALGTGIEVMQKKRFAMDINFNLLFGRVDLDDEVSDFREGAVFTVGLGFTWF